MSIYSSTSSINEDRHWQDSRKLWETNLHMLDNEILCDIAFLVGNNEENSWEQEASSLSFPPLIYQKLVKEAVKSTPKKILAHRVILVSRSSVFERMFVNDMTESKKGVNDPIRVVDIDPDIFAEMLHFIYGDSAEITNKNVFRLWYSARKYMMPYLEKLCVEHLLQNLSCRTVCTVLEHCLFFDCDVLDLKQHCLRFICLEILNIPDTEYIQLSRGALNEIISQETIGATEHKLYWICRKWAESRVEELGYAMTVACKTCRLEYEVAKSDLEALCGASGISNLMRSGKTKVGIGSKRKHKHNSSSSSISRRNKKCKHCCGKKFTAESCESSSESDCSSSDNARQSFLKSTSSWAEVKAAGFCVAQAARCVGSTILSAWGESSASHASLLPHSSASTLNDVANRADASVECSSEGRETQKDSETNSIANNSSLACRLFKCGHITDEDAQKALFLLMDKTDVLKNAALRQILGDMFHKIRFSTMSADHFSRWLGNSSILTAEEKVAIYYDMTMRKKKLSYKPKDGSATFDREPRKRPVSTMVNLYGRMVTDESNDESDDESDDEEDDRSVHVSFRVTKPIILEGVGLFTGVSSDCEPFKVEATVRLQFKPISKCKVTINPLPDKGVQTVNFNPCVYIFAERWYDIDCTIHNSQGPRFHGEDQEEVISVDPSKDNAPKFFFEADSRKGSGRNGQIASLQFSYL